MTGVPERNSEFIMGGFLEKSKKFIVAFIPASKRFVADTISEVRKSSWPPKSELKESTLLVIISVVILGFYVAGVDSVIRNVLNLLITK